MTRDQSPARKLAEPDASLHGRYITKHFAKRRYWGVVQYLGEHETPPYVFCIWYEDGDSELMTRPELERLLVPVSTPIPAMVQRFKPPKVPTHLIRHSEPMSHYSCYCTYRPGFERLWRWS